MIHSTSIVLLAFASKVASAVPAASTAKHLYQFPSGTFVENIIIRPNNDLLLTLHPATYCLHSIRSHQNLTLSCSYPTLLGSLALPRLPRPVCRCRGEHFCRNNDLLKPEYLYPGFPARSTRIKKSFPIAAAGFPNGIAALPSLPAVVLISDSVEGKIWRVDTSQGKIELAWQDPSLGPGDTGFGVNGIKIFHGYLYYASTSTGILSRVWISEDGRRFEHPEVVARLSDSSLSFDDFSIDSCGVIYAAVHPNTVERIWPDGKQDTLVGGNSTLLEFPTSTAIARNGHVLFVTTGGVTNTDALFKGQIVQVGI